MSELYVRPEHKEIYIWEVNEIKSRSKKENRRSFKR